MRQLGIPTAVHYPKPLHHQVAYAEYCCPDCCPNSVRAGEQVMSLAMSPDPTDAQMAHVAAALTQAMGSPAG
jgi:UDP-2-acetamido-2-deoxy-ribo-hexuluronate aminotransferase